MGASNSKIDEDKALQLCRERKKFVKQALHGRCQLAETHVNYIQCLKIVGPALRKFVEPDAPIESSLFTSINATPEPFVLTEKSASRFSFSTPSRSQRVDTTDNFSPTPSPPTLGRYQTNHMKFRGSFSRKVEEKPSIPVVVSVTSSSTPQNTTPRSMESHDNSIFEAPPMPPGTPPWDFFGLPHPIDNSHFSSQDGLEIADEIRKLREEEGIPDLEDENEKDSSSSGTEESRESEDEFDDPSNDTLVRSFENVNRASDHMATSGITKTVASETEVGNGYTEVGNGYKGNSPDLSPLRAASPGVVVSNDVKTTLAHEDDSEGMVAPKDFFSSMKDIEQLFLKASDSGREVPRMLEANKFHFRPIFPAKEGGTMKLTFFKACFSCGEDPSQIQEVPPQTSVKYLTWHRTTSSRSSSSRNPLGSKDEIEDLTSNLFDNFCMVSGSHASTLDRLFAWERKLYDEVKASQIVRRDYDSKCKLLRHLESRGGQLESRGESARKIDKTRAVVKDLHSRIRVSIHRIDSISKKIEELRDRELQPQLEELIEGLRRMWEEMFECHKLQFQIISMAITNGSNKVFIHSEIRRQITIYLEDELSSLSSSFTKWVGAQKSYLQAINGWLFKCVIQQKTSRRKRRMQPPPIRNFGPPIYVICGVWLEKLDTLPTKEVVDSIKGLASEITRFLPRQEKNQAKGLNKSDSTVNLLRDEASEDCVTGFDGFRSRLVGFLEKMNNYAESSVNMFNEVQKAIQDAKSREEQSKSQS